MLFGHQDDANRSSEPTSAPSVAAPQNASAAGVNPLAVDPATGISLPVAPADEVVATAPANPQDEPSVLDQPGVQPYSQTAISNDPAPTTPFGDSQAAPATPVDTTVTVPASTVVEPAAPASTLDSEPTTVAAPDPNPVQSFDSYNPSTPATDSSADLLSIKQQALSQLGPLVSQLDQNPEEKFRTTMMLIQSTDNAGLLKDAYSAAQSITDEKVRAQALLDVVNEINYFTQQNGNTGQQASNA